MRPSRQRAPIRRIPQAATPRHDLMFCAVCQVSIASAEIESGEARRTPRGRVFCGFCAASTPAEREQRRAELEMEFADDAPIPVPAPIEMPPPIPTASAAPPMSTGAVDVVFLDRRVGELERAAFRLQARLAGLEEKLDDVLRRLDG